MNKIIHFINTGESFSYMYYLSIATALKTQQHDRVILWLAKTPSGKWFDAIKNRVECRSIQESDRWDKVQTENTFKFSSAEASEIHAANIKDLFMYRVLYEMGGMYLDLDCLCLKDAWDVYDGKPHVILCDAINNCPNPAQSCFLMSDAGSPVIKQMYDRAIEMLNEKTLFSYGCFGPKIVSDVVKDNVSQVTFGDPCKIIGAGNLDISGYGKAELNWTFNVDDSYPADGKFLRDLLRNNNLITPQPGVRILHLWNMALKAHWNNLQGPNTLRSISKFFESMVKTVLTKEEYDPHGELGMTEVKLPFGGNRYRTLENAIANCKPRKIVEIGVYDGECACWMIQRTPHKSEDIEYYGFDLFRPLTQDEQRHECQTHSGAISLPEIEKKIRKMGVNSVRLFAGYTKDTIPAAISSQSITGPVDLIFIDGGHNPETIELDWKMVQPLIGKDTLIVFDDYYSNNPKEGAKLIIERLMKDPKWKTTIGADVDGIDDSQVTVQMVSENPAISIGNTNKVVIPLPMSATNGRLTGLRFHLPGLAHLPTIRENSACAYTQKIIRLAKMLRAEGGYVMFYGVEGSEVECDEYNVVLSKEDWAADFGNYDRTANLFQHGFQYKATNTFNQNMIEEVNKRKSQRDFILLPMGSYHKPVADAVKLMPVESGIGYGNTVTQFQVFETYSWMMHVYGMDKRGGSPYHTVIPNCYGMDEFPFQEKKDDYFLYMGRVQPDKGVGVAIEVAKRLNIKLLIVGQGDSFREKDLLGMPNIHRMNAVGPKERSELMGKARGVFVPTQYIEPFGGVAVEAQMCGTPVITTDFGAFPETVLDGITGFRCSILQDFIGATQNIDRIDPKKCRGWAEARFSLAVGQRLYARYFRRLTTLWDQGWYTV